VILGADIGNRGAVAVLDDNGELIAVFDMPCLEDGPKGRPTLNPTLLSGIIARSGVSHAYVEWVGSRPTDGPQGAFAFGRARGALEGILAAHGVPVTFLTAPTWKRLVGIPPGRDGVKDLARSEAIRRWPSHAELFAKVKDDGRAEAALIAVAGLRREAKP
jgi:crossover junction endodeoxyribonuclease RuvC